MTPQSPKSAAFGSDFAQEAALNADALAADLAEAGTPDPAPPLEPGVKPKCGPEPMVQNVRDSVVVLPAVGTSPEGRYIPLYISDKAPGWRLTATRPRIACVLSVEVAADGGARILLSTKPDPKAAARQAWIAVPAARGKLAGPAEDDPNFLLLRQVRPFDYVPNRDLVKAALDEPARFCAALGKAADCADGVWAADRLIMRALRLEMEPPNLTAAVRTEHRARIGPLIDGLPEPGARLAGWAVARNELSIPPSGSGSGASPYELIDAGVASGLSHGWQQIDVGTNSDGCTATQALPCVRAPWRAALARVVAADSTNVAMKTVAQQKLFERRVQEMNYDVYLALRRDWGAINAALWAERAGVDQLFANYAAGRAKCLDRLEAFGPPFAGSPFLKLYVLDLVHVTGAGSAIVKAANAGARASYAQSGDAAAAEAAAFAGAMGTEWAKAKPINAELLTVRRDGVRDVVSEHPELAAATAPAGTCALSDADLGLK